MKGVWICVSSLEYRHAEAFISSLLLSAHHHHPADAELVRDHPVSRRPKRFGEWHVDLTTVGQCVERNVGIRLGRNRYAKRKPSNFDLSSQPSDAMIVILPTVNEACMILSSKPGLQACLRRTDQGFR